MKLLFSILALFMLYMSCLPCGDGNECKDTAQQETSIAANQAKHDHSPEICTPFCICNCCASANIIPANIQQKEIAPAVGQLKYSHLQDNFHSYSSHSVWQPPRAQAFV